MVFLEKKYINKAYSYELEGLILSGTSNDL